MRRILTVIAAAGLAAALVASAANLNVDAATLQAGEDIELRCDADGGVTADWGLETSDNSVRYVNIEDIHANCEGSELFATVTIDGVVTELGGEVIVDSDVRFDFSSPYPTPESITALQVFIEG